MHATACYNGQRKKFSKLQQTKLFKKHKLIKLSHRKGQWKEFYISSFFFQIYANDLIRKYFTHFGSTVSVIYLCVVLSVLFYIWVCSHYVVPLYWQQQHEQKQQTIYSYICFSIYWRFRLLSCTFTDTKI